MLNITRRRFVKTAVAASTVSFIPSVFAEDSFPMKEFLADLDEIMKVDSPTGYEEGVNKVVDIIAQRFAKIGWTVNKMNCPGRGDMMIASNTPDQSKFDVLLSIHADTVQPVGNAAKYPLTIDGNMAHGAGVADDKSSITAVWWICKDLPEAAKKLKIGVLLNPGEEDSNPSTREKISEFGGKTKLAMVYEPGRPGNGCVKIRKGSMTLTIEFKGVTAHAGNEPEKGRNAIEAMALAIPQIKAVADKYPGVTLNADLVEGGTVVNAIADHAVVKIDFRFKDDTTRDKAIEDVQALCDKGFAPDVKSELTYSKGSALALTPQSEKLIAIVDKAAAELKQEPLKWLEVGGSSDGNRLSGAGAAVVCAMGVVGGDLHNPEKEWSDLSTVKPRIDLGKKTLELIAKGM